MAKETDEQIALLKAELEASRAENAAIFERVKRLENPGIPQKAKRTKEHVCSLRMWDDRLVVRTGKAVENFALPETSPKRLVWDITLVDAEGKEKTETVNYLDFIINAEKVQAKITKLERDVRVETELKKGGGGKGNRRGKISDKSLGVVFTGGAGDLAGIGLTGEEIDMEVEFTDVTVEVSVLEGPFTGKTFSFTPETINAINI